MKPSTRQLLKRSVWAAKKDTPLVAMGKAMGVFDEQEKKLVELMGLREPEPTKEETLAEFRERMRTPTVGVPTPALQAALDEIASRAEFQVPEAQWRLWENQMLEEAHANLAGDPKELLLFYLEEILPLTTEKGAVFPVLLFLWKRMPESFAPFKVSHQEIAKGSGAGVRSVQRAIAFLEEKDLIKVMQEPWSPKKSSRAEYTLLSLAKLRHTPTWRTRC